ncbi:MAG: DNA mismatch repair protein MutS [Tepidiformaceae bacterium]
MSTPIRRQYLELKRRYSDTLLFFRLGDFYETFDDDAKLVAAELSITLTSKPLGKDLRVPLAGVPYHSIDGHVSKLVKRGYRVAICEQMADPADVKGIVPREVVRVVTAGTITEDNSLEPTAPNYLAALAVRRGETAVAVAEITTGEVMLVSGPDAVLELARANPAELLVEDAADVPPGLETAVRVAQQLSEMAVDAEISRQFGDGAGHLAGNAAEAAALAHLIGYLRETYAAALGSIQRVRRPGDSATLVLDPRTIRNLDILPQSGHSGSLFDVLNGTRSAMGARLLRERLVRPLRDALAIGARLDAAEWARTHPIEREQGQGVLDGMTDLGRLAGRVGARSAGPRDLHGLRAGLRATFDLGAILARCEVPAELQAATAKLAGAADPLLALDAALDEDPPTSFVDGGVIREGFNPEIDTLRSLARDARGFLLGLERQERERTGIKSLKVGHNRVFGYYIEISAANAGAVPDDYQRRQTLVGAERYVTEQLKEYESNLVGARDRLVELERAVFAQLVETLAAGLAGLQEVAGAVAQIDVALGLGQVAAERDYCRPAFEDGGEVLMQGARHPVVERSLGPGRFVPNDCALGAECQVILLTGPNMSGKSTFLRQVALIAVMAQAGSFVPAASARLPLFDRVFTRIGAQDDLAAGQSTFMVEMVETAAILHQATRDSLIVLDEVGRGTSTFDGMAIARAVVEFIHNRPELGAKTLFATHYHELTALSDVLPRVKNFHVAVHEQGTDVVFEHRIVPGPSDRSYGIHVARLAGLPQAVVHRAETLLTELEGSRPAPGATVAPATNGHAPQLTFFAKSEVEEAVAALDVDGLTPIEAIQKLYELRALARAGAKG